MCADSHWSQLNLLSHSAVGGFTPLPHCGFDVLVETNETAPNYK